MNDILKAVVSAVIAYLVPSVLKKIGQEVEQGAHLPWLRWSIAGALGGAAGGIASAILGAMSGGLALNGFGNWAAFGLCIGFAQWAALRGYRPVGAWWVLASTIGWALFGLGGVWGWVLSGLIVGILQTFSLTRYTGAGWWIIANPVAWWIAGWLGIFIGTPLLASNPPLAWVIGWAVVGLAGAVLLAVPLARVKIKAGGPVEH